MVKFLICGNLEHAGDAASESAFLTLVKRVEALEKSNHGPFECLLVAGGLFQDERSYRDALGSSSILPIPAYAIDCPAFVDIGELPANLTYLDRSGGSAEGRGCGMSTIHKLTVCWVNDSSKEKGDVAEMESNCGAPGYRGCDVLLSSSWPKNSHNFLNNQEVDELKTLNIALGAGSENVTKTAVTCRPRYHFIGGDKSRAVFYQRTPYTNPGGIHAPNASAPATRMISLACAPLENSTAPASKEKCKKWMHALSLEPIVYLKPEELLGIPSGSRYTDCPYLESATIISSNKRPLDEGDGAAQQMDKRFKADGQGQGTGVFFFGGSANDLSGERVGSSGNRGQQVATNLTPPSPTAVKLFIGNLPRDYTQEQILRLLPGAVTLHRPLDKSKPKDPMTGQYLLKNFCFVHFIEHAKAAKVVEASVNKGVLMGGRTVTVGWAAEKQAPGKDQPPPPSSTPSILSGVPPPPPAPTAPLGSQPPSADATVLFLGNLPPLTRRMVNSSGEVEEGDEDLYGGPDVDSQLLQELHKKFVGIVSFNRVTNKRYAFVEFASHAEAYLAWQMAESGSGEGGAKGLKINGRILLVAWASGSRQYNNSTDTATTSSAASASAKATEMAQVVPIAQAAVLLEAPDKDCKTLFLGNVPPEASDKQLLGLMDQVTKALKIRPEEEAGGAEVRHPEGKQFAFLTFTSHEVTAEIMAARSTTNCQSENVPEWKDKSTDTTPSSTQTLVGAVKLCIADRDLTLGWAKGKGADRRPNASNGGKKTGATDDHTADCWFCLASGNLRTHLVLSVAEHCYMAMPRGALHPLHCLVSSIQCVPSKSHLSTAAIGEFKRYEECLDSLYRQDGMALMSFERAIRTRGKDHMQQHFVPVPAELVEGAEDAFHAVVKRHNDKHRERGGEGEPLRFVEVSDEETRGVEELVLALPGGPFQEYFAISLPSMVSIEDEKGNSGVDWIQKRFIYAHDRSSTESNEKREGYSWRFPMQLGTELAANILKEPSKAFWKDCVVAEEEEVTLSAGFKSKFDPLDFTGDE